MSCAKDYAEAKAYAHAEAYAEAIIAKDKILNPLALDCLWLSIYFFHPIQQCAQQVYHTAIPLSPTSSQVEKYYLQSVTNNPLSHVTAFLGAPGTWGSLLRTIDIRPRQLTCLATSAQSIITVCEDIVNTYDAVTFALQQSLCIPETVTKIQDSPDGTILFFAHSFSVTMWDVQTGGLIHTFATPSKINDIAVSTTGDFIACGLSDGFVALWRICTRTEGIGFWGGQPVVTICWLSNFVIAVATQNTLHIHDISSGISDCLSIPGHVWGMVHSKDTHEVLVGISQPSSGTGQGECFFMAIRYPQCVQWPRLCLNPEQSPMTSGQLSSPILVHNKIVCIASAGGVRLFDTRSYCWTNSPPLLDVATSVAISLNRNLVVQTKDSIQIFSIGVLTSDSTHNGVQLSYIYPLGEKHIICLLQPNRHLAVLELETLQEIHPDRNCHAPDIFHFSFPLPLFISSLKDNTKRKPLCY